MLWLERLRKVFLTGDTMPAYRSAGEDAPNRKMRKDKIVIHLSSPLLNGRGDVLLMRRRDRCGSCGNAGGRHCHHRPGWHAGRGAE